VYKLRDRKTGSSSFVTVRGAVSITGGSAQAIYVVDVFVDGSEASALSSNDIESVSVLKDGASAAIYECVEGMELLLLLKR
jgi:outer membrane receptor protein involved in Fe transport